MLYVVPRVSPLLLLHRHPPPPRYFSLRREIKELRQELARRTGEAEEAKKALEDKITEERVRSKELDPDEVNRRSHRLAVEARRNSLTGRGTATDHPTCPPSKPPTIEALVFSTYAWSHCSLSLVYIYLESSFFSRAHTYPACLANPCALPETYRVTLLIAGASRGEEGREMELL